MRRLLLVLFHLLCLVGKKVIRLLQQAVDLLQCCKTLVVFSFLLFEMAIQVLHSHTPFSRGESLLLEFASSVGKEKSPSWAKESVVRSCHRRSTTSHRLHHKRAHLPRAGLRQGDLITGRRTHAVDKNEEQVSL